MEAQSGAHSERKGFTESLHRGFLCHISPTPCPGPSDLILPCQAVATSRTSRAPGPMASVGKRQADAGLGGGWALGSPLLAPQGRRMLAGHVPLHCTNYLSCFPLLPPWADPLLPLLARQSNHRVWKSWVFRRKQSHDPRGRSWESGAGPA